MPAKKRSSSSHSEIKPRSSSIETSRASKRTKRDKLPEAETKANAKQDSDSPFAEFDRPTEKDCQQVHRALLAVHGPPPSREDYKFEDDEVDAVPTDAGKANDILDAVVRILLGLNTSARNYRASKKGLDSAFGRGDYEAVRLASLESVVQALQPGGLANVKGKRIKKLLDQVYERNGQNKLSLEDLKTMSSEEAFTAVLDLHGCGPKVAACILSYQLGKDYFAVDTHIFRICKKLGWIPEETTNRDKAYQHLNTKIPDELKYDLHLLFIQHGRICKNCAAGPIPAGKGLKDCALKQFMN